MFLIVFGSKMANFCSFLQFFDNHHWTTPLALKSLGRDTVPVQARPRAPNKRAPFGGAFLFAMIPTIRQELRDELPVKQGVDNALQGRDE